ncbi:MAG TPA: universal stress protein [Candidatus Limnocylindria bacterium]|nr:universal stress protein [Candidatus Limnocylindria bacterium]
MRILLAYDASSGAEQARDLLGNLNLPEATVVTVASVVRPASPLFEIETVRHPDAAEAERQMTQQVEAELASAARFLVTAGRKVEQRVLRGRPAEEIVREADRLDADLVVMGSRGHGPFRSALLGSVSTEVVNASSRPVLIARGISVHRVLVATDGTATSSLALDLVATWRIFEAVELTVLSVSEPVSSWVSLDRMDVESASWLELETELAEERRLAHVETARADAEKLNQVGRRAAHEVRVGNPAHEIVQAADELDVDLIVTGSRPSSAELPGAIGSVARNVVQHARASVLVAREPSTLAAVNEAASDAVATTGD